MHKSIPFSLGLIAVSLAAIAGTIIYEQIKAHEIQEAALARIEETARLMKAQQEEQAHQQCAAKIETLSGLLPALNRQIADYAPDPKVKNPDTLNDVQAILQKSLIEQANQINKDISALRSQCPEAPAQVAVAN